MPAGREAIKSWRNRAPKLAHPNIVSAHDAGTAGERYFLVMEYVEGLNLSDLVKKRGPLPIPEACDYVRHHPE